MPALFRFAPSPNGRLHLGHAYSALLNGYLARQVEGRFLLRIEDIDFTRARPEFIEGIYEDLAWLGLAWERPVRQQSDHMSFYQDALNRLRRRELVYPCYASRRDILAAVHLKGKEWPRTPDGGPLYPGLYRHISKAQIREKAVSGTPCAWRLDMKRALDELEKQTGQRTLPCRVLMLPQMPAKPLRLSMSPEASFETEIRHLDPAPWGDVVLGRKDIGTSYHMAVVMDDAVQGVTHIVRGQDLEAATAIHLLLQFLLDVPSPFYHHHPLIKTPTGLKLSKSRKDRSLQAMREEGMEAANIRAQLGFGES